jgi:hypothetical protein
VSPRVGGQKRVPPTQIFNLGSLSKCMFTINIYKYKEREGGGGPTGWGYPNSFRVFAHTRRTHKAVGTTSSKPPLHPPPYHPSIPRFLTNRYLELFDHEFDPPPYHCIKDLQNLHIPSVSLFAESRSASTSISRTFSYRYVNRVELTIPYDISLGHCTRL